MDLRSNPSQIDASWLTQVLQKNYPGSQVNSLEA